MKRWPLRKAAFWESAPFFRFLPPLAAGIAFYFLSAPTAIPPAFDYSIIAGAALMLVALTPGKRAVPHPIVFFLLMNASLFCTGHLLAYYSDIRNDPAWFGQHISSGSLAVIGSEPLEKESGWKCSVTVLGNIDDGKMQPACGDAYLHLYKGRQPMLLQKGDTVLLPGKWTSVKNSGNPFGFDYAGWCRMNNIFYEQYCPQSAVRLYGARNPGAMPLIVKVHDWCANSLNSNITNDTTRRLLRTMLLGDPLTIDEDLRQRYSETGVMHIMSVSGIKIALFLPVLSALLWWLRHKRYAWVKYVAVLPLIWLYAAAAGATPSAIRAAIAFTLMAIGIMLDKPGNNLNRLLAASFVMLCAAPAWLFSAGFQLSFTAVLSIVLFYKPVNAWIRPKGKAGRWLWSCVAAGIAAKVLAAPLTAWNFHSFPLFFVIGGVVAYAFLLLIMALGTGIIVCSDVPQVAAALGSAADVLVHGFNTVAGWLQQGTPEPLRTIQIDTLELAVIYIAVAGIAIFLLRRQKAALFTGLASACCLLALLCRDEWQRCRQLRFVVYDIPHTVRIEKIEGPGYAAVSGNQTIANSAITDAHVGWQALHETQDTNEVFMIGGKTVLVLNQPVSAAPGKRFPADYLIVNYSGKVDPQKLQSLFSPSLLIIGGNIRRNQQSAIARKCSAAGISLHAVARDGAWVLSAP